MDAQGVFSYLAGPGLVPQILLVVIIFLVSTVVINLIEIAVNTFKKMGNQTTVLEDNTITDYRSFVQNPDSDYLIYNSSNDPNGLAFTYSVWIFIDPKTFESSRTQQCTDKTTNVSTTYLKHILNKGNKNCFPLLAPGIFVKGDSNTIRIYMNSSTAWNNFVEVPNIPVGKWFHLAVIQKGKNMDVYVNGNIAVREEFHSVPKLNEGNVFVLNSQVKFPLNPNTPLQLGDFRVDGAMVGMLSRIKYFAFAANYAQIDQLYREGPSSVIKSKSYVQTPPYFYDDWWVNRY